MNNKGNKLLIIVAVLLFCIICFFIYYFFFSSLNKNSIEYYNPRSMVEGYVESLINKDYKKAIKYIYLPDNSYVNSKDFEEYIKTKYYYDIIDKMKITNIIEEEPTLFNIVLNDNKDNTLKISINLIERTINDYRIDESDIYITDYMFSVPKNTNVFIDNYEVRKELLVRTSNDDDIYLIPAIGAFKKTFKLVNKLSTKETDVIPSNSNDIIKFNVELNNDELKDKAYSFIKNMWNNMYSGYSKKDDVSNYMKYFDESFDESNVKYYYSKSFKKISTGLTSIGKFQNYKITNIVDNLEEPSLIISDELINVSFGYTLSWKWKFNGADSAVKMSMNRYSSIVLKIQDDSFVVYEVPDVGLFNYTSQYTRDF